MKLLPRTGTFLCFFVSFLLQTCLCLAQAEIDSITLTPVLKGNSVLYGSRKVARAKMAGYELKSFSSDGCAAVSESPKEVLVVHQKDSVLVVDVQVTTNCGMYFLGEIEVIQDSILHLNAHEYGVPELCECQFCLHYEIASLSKKTKKGSKQGILYLMFDSNRTSLIKIR